MAEIDWSKINAAQALGGPQKMSWPEGFAKSFAWSFPNLVGVHEPANVAQWRAENPVSAIGSELLGFAVPYAGWANVAKTARIAALGEKLATTAPKLANVLKYSTSGHALAEAPFKARAAREIVRFAPLEVGRIATGAAFGEDMANAVGTSYEGTGTLVAKAGIDLVAGGALAGGFSKLGAAGKAFKKETHARPGADLSAPAQIQMRQIQEAVDSGKLTEDGLVAANRAITNLEEQIRRATPGPKARYVQSLDPKKSLDGKADAHAVNRLFKAGDSPNMLRARFERTAKGFTQEQLDQAMVESGLKQGDFAYMQYPRYLEAKTLDGAKDFRRVARKLGSAAENTYWMRDTDDGLFVMMKKVKGETDKAAAGDKWLLFKTDKPGRFAPEQDAWRKAVISRSAWMADKPFRPEGEVAQTLLNMRDGMDVYDMTGFMQKKGSMVKVAETLMKKMGWQHETGELSRRAALFADRYLAPTMFQFRNSPLAARLAAITKATADAADEVVNKRFFGAKAISKSKNLYGDIVSGGVRAGDDTIDKLIDDVYLAGTKDINTVAQAAIKGLKPEDAVQQFGGSDAALKLLRKLDEIDQLQLKDLHAVQKASGNRELKAMPNHYMIGHNWIGDWRVPIKKDGHLLWVASGKDRGGAMRIAKEVAEEMGDPKVVIEQPRLSDFKLDQEMLREIVGRAVAKSDKDRIRDIVSGKVAQVYEPARFKTTQRKVGGFKTEWTKNELKEQILKNMRETQKHIAEVSVRHGLDDEFKLLGQLDEDVALQLEERVSARFGKQGPMAKWQNDMADKVLSPIMGKNSATKMVGTMNKYMFNLTLGFGNMSYALANALTFIQTGLPHIAFVTKATPEQVSKYYSWWPVMGGKSAGHVGAVDIFKVAKQSFAEMGKPSAELKAAFERAAREGVWDPRYVEEYVGQTSRRVMDFKAVLSGEEPMTDFVKRVAEFTPSITEKFSRGHSFVLGYITGRDLLGLADEGLYRFARDFTEKTMFNYSAADRAKVITGPFGSAIGLFKNWVMHYIGWMMEYTGQGVLHGNWTPFLWMTGGTAALGGVGSLAGYEFFNGMSKWLTGSSATDNLYQTFGGGRVADTVFHGLPALLGISIQNQVAAPFADPGQDAARLFGFAYWDRMKALGTAVGHAVDHHNATGQMFVNDAHTRDALIRAMAPKTLYRIASVNGDQIRSMTTGHPMVDGMGLADRYLYMAGINPVMVDRHYRVANELWQDQEKMKSTIQAMGQRMADAMLEGDNATFRDVIYRAVAEGVDMGSVIKSAQSRMARGQEDMIQSRFDALQIYNKQKLGLLRKD